MISLTKRYDLHDWRLAVSRRMQPLFIESLDDTDFHADVRLIEQSGIQLWDIAATPHHFQRTAQHARDAREPLVSLAMQLDGSGTTVQGGRTTELGPGDYTLLDWTSPYSREFETGHRMAVILVPRRVIGVSDTPTSAFNVRLDGHEGLGPLTTGLISGLLNSWPTVSRSPSDESVLQASFLILRQAIAQHLDQAEVDPVNPQRLQTLEIRRYILDNLGDPSLDPQTVADAHFMSLRQLHKLFNGDGVTVAAWMRLQRLERIRMDLGDPALKQLSLAAIFNRWGIESTTNASRLFRREFGVSPQQFRRNCT
ncbi:helix-turn-helix domain-containing protein [Gordonia rhizosphera]|uniref:Putative AraC family transcriptional regulator n=1 Tax=Gordonia rhizosphera NBRC 16068 TaxID=1108045 RepID=K6VZZ5_9ACTN|nr:helix-turn-helix domain-containing protein [Gordonia rhizosphera]GAB92485.1 putative AraC family transcriptional regulator [Gordonia rhizosphera NBRC 16068]